MLEIFLVQMEIAPNDKAKNFEKVESLTQGIRKDCGTDAGIIVLPEMFATGYLPLHPEKAAEDFSSESSGETAHFLNKLANQTGCSVLGAGISGIGTTTLTNHASVYMPGDSHEYACYDKRRPFFMEQGKFSAGEDVSLFKINEWNIAPTICFDLRFPELYRDAARAGANLITVQAAWPAERAMHWDTLLQARAIENQAYVAAVNCVSKDGKYTGHSRIIDPFGNIVAKADTDSECIVSARIDLQPLLKYREDFPVLRDI